MDIRYSKNTERPVAEIVKEHFSLTINKPAGEYDRNLTDIQLYAGDVYKVKHNGSEYTCVAYEEDGAIHIGGESEPFDIYNFAGDIYAKAATDGANTFEVHHEKVNSLPYEAMPAGYPGTKTEMVEIVPEQSVTKTSSWDDVHQNEMSDFVIEVNGESDYIVKINGNGYKCKAEFVGGEDFYMIGNNETVPFSIEIYDDMAVVMWEQSLGETITLAIYEEKEVVQQIEPKFVGGGVSCPTPIFYVGVDRNTRIGPCRVNDMSASYEDVMSAFDEYSSFQFGIVSNDHETGTTSMYMSPLVEITEDRVIYIHIDDDYKLELSSDYNYTVVSKGNSGEPN